MFQGRVDYAFDVGQALNASRGSRGPKHLYIGQFGHTPRLSRDLIRYVLGRALPGTTTF